MRKKSQGHIGEPANKAPTAQLERITEVRGSAKPAQRRKIQKTKREVSQSKSDRVLVLLGQANGVTIDELMKVTKWQAHSVRGFLSGAVRKRKGLTMLSARDGEGVRRYRIEAGTGA